MYVVECQLSLLVVLDQLFSCFARESCVGTDSLYREGIHTTKSHHGLCVMAMIPCTRKKSWLCFNTTFTDAFIVQQKFWFDVTAV